MRKLDHFKQLLLVRMRELDNRLHNIEDELDTPSAADTEDRATEREEDEVLESLGNAGLQEYKLIKAALGRFDDGSYGSCVTCGEQISDERLEVIPHATQCRNCA